MTKRTTKSALLLSALSLLMCVAMLVGSTYAWFTDSVSSGNNIILAGSLKVGMQWADGTADPEAETTAWTDASLGAIFHHTLWEPGYAEIRHIRISNDGTLALKYAVNLKANGNVSSLAEVIDVFFADPAVQTVDGYALNDSDRVGTLAELLAGTVSAPSGTLAPGESTTLTVALRLRKDAGNEYQDLSIGSDFSFRVLATQPENPSDPLGV